MCYYPAKDLLFYHADIHGKQLVKQRIEALQMLMEKEDNVTVITTFDGFMDSMIPPQNMKSQILTLESGETLDFDI